MLIVCPSENLETSREEVQRIVDVMKSTNVVVDILCGTDASALNVLRKFRSGQYDLIPLFWPRGVQ